MDRALAVKIGLLAVLLAYYFFIFVPGHRAKKTLNPCDASNSYLPYDGPSFFRVVMMLNTFKTPEMTVRGETMLVPSGEPTPESLGVSGGAGAFALCEGVDPEEQQTAIFRQIFQGYSVCYSNQYSCTPGDDGYLHCRTGDGEPIFCYKRTEKSLYFLTSYERSCLYEMLFEQGDYLVGLPVSEDIRELPEGSAAEASCS